MTARTRIIIFLPKQEKILTRTVGAMTRTRIIIFLPKQEKILTRTVGAMTSF